MVCRRVGLRRGEHPGGDSQEVLAHSFIHQTLGAPAGGHSNEQCVVPAPAAGSLENEEGFQTVTVEQV